MKTAILLLVSAMMLAPMASAGHSVTVTSGDATGSTYKMTVDVKGFNLVDFTGKDAKKGEGHIHYLINGAPAPGDYATTSKSFTFTGLKDGDVLTAELVLSDHTGSGTDENGNLNGKSVKSSEVVVGESNGAPSIGLIAGAGALLGIALLVRRK